MSVIVAIPWWRDGDLLDGALESVEQVGLEAICLDGAYRTYAPDGPWLTPEAEQPKHKGAAMISHGRGYAHEAEKRTALLRHAADAGAGWVLFLDSDERLEGDAAALVAWTDAVAAVVVAVNVYLDQPGAGGWYVPRLLRLTQRLEFRPPRDFDVWSGDTLVAAPGREGLVSECVPGSVMRIRHDRHLRPPERLLQTRHYLLRRDEPDRAEERIRADIAGRRSCA